jgi:hypothetical protein
MNGLYLQMEWQRIVAFGKRYAFATLCSMLCLHVDCDILLFEFVELRWEFD